MRFTFDSNILVYSVDLDAGSKHLAAAALLKQAARGDCILCVQSLAEFFHVSTRKGKLPSIEAANYVESWRNTFPVYFATIHELDRAIRAVRTDGLSFWDALLWAAARQAGCTLLLTEDMQDGRTLGGVTFANPFAPANAGLLDGAVRTPF